MLIWYPSRWQYSILLLLSCSPLTWRLHSWGDHCYWTIVPEYIELAMSFIDRQFKIEWPANPRTTLWLFSHISVQLGSERLQGPSLVLRAIALCPGLTSSVNRPSNPTKIRNLLKLHQLCFVLLLCTYSLFKFLSGFILRFVPVVVVVVVVFFFFINSLRPQVLFLFFILVRCCNISSEHQFTQNPVPRLTLYQSLF